MKYVLSLILFALCFSFSSSASAKDVYCRMKKSYGQNSSKEKFCVSKSFWWTKKKTRCFPAGSASAEAQSKGCSWNTWDLAASAKDLDPKQTDAVIASTNQELSKVAQDAVLTEKQIETRKKKVKELEKKKDRILRKAGWKMTKDGLVQIASPTPKSLDDTIKSLQKVNAEIYKLEDKIDINEGQVGELETDLEEISSQQAALREQIVKRQDELLAAAKDAADAKAKSEAAEQKRKLFRQEIRKEGLLSKLDGFKKRLDTIEEDRQEIENELQGSIMSIYLHAKFQELNKQLCNAARECVADSSKQNPLDLEAIFPVTSKLKSRSKKSKKSKNRETAK